MVPCSHCFRRAGQNAAIAGTQGKATQTECQCEMTYRVLSPLLQETKHLMIVKIFNFRDKCLCLRKKCSLEFEIAKKLIADVTRERYCTIKVG